MKEKIDIVITWVDDTDLEWIKEKNFYSKNQKSDSRDIRFRDWGILQYLFRGIQEYAPWVNNVFLVTWGHLPEWLNVSHPKLNIIKHDDFIPKSYLPTFSSHTIELNLHRIKGLSDKFVYFNDDIFFTKPTNSIDFFKKDLPRDYAVLRPNISEFRQSTAAIEANNLEIINTNYNFKRSIRKNKGKWFNLKYKRFLISTLLQLPYKKFTGFLNLHLPNSFLKSTLVETWNEEYSVLDKTCKNKFRDGRDVNQWIFRYRQLIKGEFIPRNPRIGRTYSLSNNNEDILKAIVSQKHKLICINDNGKEEIVDFEKEKQNLNNAFKEILPRKSKYEI